MVMTTMTMYKIKMKMMMMEKIKVLSSPLRKEGRRIRMIRMGIMAIRFSETL